jgi:hypothetical protein
MTASVVKLEPSKHIATRAPAYDDPRLDARGFLLATMHSPNVSLPLRIKAAADLLKLDQAEPVVVYYGDSDGEEPTIRYVIGGIPDA